jgi:prepilin-type N-terminal cleavage/methylation domain-containing protein
MRSLIKVKALIREQRGLTLLETLIAIGILAVIGSAFLTALNTTSKSTSLYERRVAATNLAHSQMEEIKAMSYDPNGNYPVIVNLPPSYIMSISTVEVEANKQEVTVKVTQGEHYLLELTTIKTNW